MGPMNLGLSVLLSFRQSGSFLKISSVVFAETQYGLKITRKVSLDRQSFFFEKSLLGKNEKRGQNKRRCSAMQKIRIRENSFPQAKSQNVLTQSECRIL